MTGTSLGDASGRDSDEPVEVIVDNTEDYKRDEHHHHKVSNENIVSAVVEVVPELCGTN